MSEMSFDWGDPKLREMTTRQNDWYKCSLGHADIVKIVGKCDAVWRHNWTDDQGKFRTAMCSHQDHGSCPVCAAAAGLMKHQRVLCYATTVLHLFRVNTATPNSPRLVGRLLAWRFGDDKRTALLEINEVTNGRLMQVPLRISLKENTKEGEQFQKLLVNHIPDLSRYPMTQEQTKALKDLLGKQEALETIRRLYHPTPEDIEKFFKPDEVPASAYNPEFETGGGTPGDAADFLSDAAGLGDALDGGADPLKGVL